MSAYYEAVKHLFDDPELDEFFGFKPQPEPVKRTLTRIELRILAKILHGIWNDKYFETMCSIKIDDLVILYGLIDKIDKLDKQYNEQSSKP